MGMKYTKKDADYGLSSSPSEHRCGICEFLLDTPGVGLECGIVEGDIENLYGCKFYSVDLIKAANDPLNLHS
jgi:hypothetical protein